MGSRLDMIGGGWWFRLQFSSYLSSLLIVLCMYVFKCVFMYVLDEWWLNDDPNAISFHFLLCNTARNFSRVEFTNNSDSIKGFKHSIIYRSTWWLIWTSVKFGERSLIYSPSIYNKNHSHHRFFSVQKFIVKVIGPKTIHPLRPIISNY